MRATAATRVRIRWYSGLSPSFRRIHSEIASSTAENRKGSRQPQCLEGALAKHEPDPQHGAHGQQQAHGRRGLDPAGEEAAALG